MSSKIYVVLCCAFLLSCGTRQAAPAEESKKVADRLSLSEAQMKNAGLQLANPALRTLHSRLLVNGMVDVPPQNIVSVSFPLGGYLTSTALLPGMHVSRGQEIGWIEDQSIIQLQQDYLVARQRLSYLEQEYRRQDTLRQHEVNAAKVYQQAKNEYENQQVLLKALSEKLQLIGINSTGLTVAGISRKVAIHSPINGFVSKVNVNIGKYVNPTDVLFELINPEDLHASLTVFEKDMPMVHEGQKVKVSFVDDPDKWYDCETILVTRNVDESRAGMVHCHFETRPRKLLPGMFLNAVIETGNQQVTAVPETAVLRYGNADYVFEELAHGQFKLVQVATGSRDGGWIELKDWSEADSLRNIVAQNGYSLLGMLKNAEE